MATKPVIVNCSVINASSRSSKPWLHVVGCLHRLTPARLQRLPRSAVLDLPIVGEHAAGQDVIGPVDVDAAIAEHQLEQVDLVLGRELTGVLAQQSGDVRGSQDGDLAYPDTLVGTRALAGPATLGGQVHDDRSWLHAFHLGPADEPRGRPARHGGRGDDEVGLLDVPGQYVGNVLALVARQLAGVTAFTSGIDAGVDESRSK